MTQPCQHKNVKSEENDDTGAHIVFCLDCQVVSHVCFKPLQDRIERDLEEVRGWGVYYSKGYQRPSEAAGAQRKMEEILANLREAMLMARITKNEIIERLAGFFDQRGDAATAALVRDFKAELAVPEPTQKGDA